MIFICPHFFNPRAIHPKRNIWVPCFLISDARGKTADWWRRGKWSRNKAAVKPCAQVNAKFWESFFTLWYIILLWQYSLVYRNIILPNNCESNFAVKLKKYVSLLVWRFLFFFCQKCNYTNILNCEVNMLTIDILNSS